MPRIYYRVTHGSIRFNGKSYPEGAEFPASDRQMQGLRAEGVVIRITPQIVYRRVRLPSARPKKKTLRRGDSLLTMPRGELRLLRKDARFIRRVNAIFPEMTMKQIAAIKIADIIKMIIDKRGF